MSRLYRFLPPFAGDYSGVGSALYELGGMLCIHDASGCTGNYVGFDEPRSYDSKQLVYCTGLRKNDAILGNEQVYIDKIVQAAKDMKPAFIAIVGSPVPVIIGFDFNGFAKEIELATGIPAFGFETGGMKGSYKDGVVMAVNKLLDYYVLPRKDELLRNSNRNSVNIVGATPLDLSEENLEALKVTLAEHGYQLNSVLSMSNSMEEFQNFYKADVNLAITQAGALIAMDLEKKYNMPYLTGIPIGENGSKHYFKCLEQVFDTGKSMEISQVFSENNTQPFNSDNMKSQQTLAPSKKTAVIMDDGVIASSMGVELASQGYDVRVVSLFGKDAGMTGVDAEYTENEDEILKIVNDESAVLLIADPLLLQYRENKQDIQLIELPKYSISSKLSHHKRWVYIGEHWNEKIQ